MDLSNNNIDLPFDFTKLKYQRVPDLQFDISKTSLLGEMYNDNMDKGKHDLRHLNVDELDNFAWCFYVLQPGAWVPPHKDHFSNYMKYYNVEDRSLIMRKLVFLEPWKSGHVFGIDNEISLGWKANQSITWSSETSHWGGNFGTEPRYTLQITGVKK